MFDKKFDYHFLYDEEPKLVMYSYNDKSYDLSDMNVKLIIEI